MALTRSLLLVRCELLLLIVVVVIVVVVVLVIVVVVVVVVEVVLLLLGHQETKNEFIPAALIASSSRGDFALDIRADRTAREDCLAHLLISKVNTVWWKMLCDYCGGDQQRGA